MIIVVSDLHLGYNDEKCKAADFLKFLKSISENRHSKVDHFVLLGDIFDFWRSRDVEAALKGSEILDELLKLQSSGITLHYVIGNHDYTMLEFNERYPECPEGAEGSPFEVKKSLRLEDNGKEFYFMHGYELEVLANYEPFTIENYESISKSFCRVTSTLGKFLSSIWNIGQKIKYGSIQDPPEKRLIGKREERMKKLVSSPLRNLFLGVKKNETLVFGHTHKPFVDQEIGVANTGSWVDEGIQRDHNTYLEIENGKIKLYLPSDGYWKDAESLERDDLLTWN